jgi:hypothetical protein
MGERSIVMLRLVGNDLVNRGGDHRIGMSKLASLFIQMAQNHAFNRYCRRRNCLWSDQAGCQTQYQSAYTT